MEKMTRLILCVAVVSCLIGCTRTETTGPNGGGPLNNLLSSFTGGSNGSTSPYNNMLQQLPPQFSRMMNGSGANGMSEQLNLIQQLVQMLQNLLRNGMQLPQQLGRNGQQTNPMGMMSQPFNGMPQNSFGGGSYGQGGQQSGLLDGLLGGGQNGRGLVRSLTSNLNGLTQPLGITL